MNHPPLGSLPKACAEAWLTCALLPRWAAPLVKAQRDYRSRDHYLLYAVFDTELELESYRFSCPVPRFHAAVVPPACQHRLRVPPEQDPHEVLRVGFHLDPGHGGNPFARMVLPTAVPIDDRQGWRDRCEHCIELLEQQRPDHDRWPERRLRSRAEIEWLLVHHCLVGYAQDLLTVSGAGPVPELVQAAALILQRAPPRAMPSIPALAADIGTSQSSLQRAFKRHFGVTPATFRRRCRLRHARRLLAGNPELQVQEVARHCGFDDHAAFTRAFVQAYGVTPRHYRQGDDGT